MIIMIMILVLIKVDQTDSALLSVIEINVQKPQASTL